MLAISNNNNNINAHTHNFSHKDTFVPESFIENKIDDFTAYENGVPLLNRYKKVSNIQDGSYGKVSLAIDLETNTKVAVKAMARTISGVKAIYRHEISILKRLGSDSSNICSLLNFFETSHHYFIIFEYCANGDLYDYLKTSKNHLNPNFSNGSPIIFKQFLKELAAAVEYSHSKKVYHRDIKPENILIDDHGILKLTDWGLATVGQYCSDPCIGTEKYLAPETYFKKSKSSNYSYDCKPADYWSIGITVLYSLFGFCPFRSANCNDSNYNNFRDDSEFLFKIYPNLSQFGYEAVMKLLEADPTKRSLDGFMSFVLENYNKGLTIDQDNYINAGYMEEYADDDIFGMEEDLVLNESFDMEVEDENDSEDLFSNVAPSSIESSAPIAVSWDQMDDIIDPNIKTTNIQTNLHNKANHNYYQPTFNGLSNSLKTYDFNWY
ncbi:hypothetical protein WICPIJ_006089 [Wickerhamomyces pijperi]|uniref:non-specific serine/threonine protein kinase n=1 Tax=Wickerhamomyces pijperi TaxID=599730 RepID=A0A9P8Q4D4_WICPI|nr:hypothetical protein WICPIJ_006089 [Wickerhamomyces pijperi]